MSCPCPSRNVFLILISFYEIQAIGYLEKGQALGCIMSQYFAPSFSDLRELRNQESFG